VARRRFGVVLLLRGAVGAEVDGLRRALGDPALGRVPPHVTLVPPVNVREQDVDAALGVLRSAAAATRPFRLTIGPPTTFLPDNPVLYLAVDGPVETVRDRVFRAPLARTLTWPFVPHVTLLDGGAEARLRAAVEALADYRAEVLVDRVHLLEERRRDDGVRVWEPVADVPFAAPAVIGRGGLELEVGESEAMAPDVAAWFDGAWSEYDARGDEPLVLTARRSGDIVGVAKGFVRGEEGHLERLITAPDVRGEGVGSHLLAAFEAAAVERGATFLSLRVRVGAPAEGLYRRRGFQTFTELPAWRHGQDFVQLRKHL
jgi:2'-5' RNA ligase/GNAT superfamily N-acetyltransferase